MQISDLQVSERHAEFTIEGVRPYFVNALRRTLLSEVPKLAIDEVTFYDNTSALFDEMIAHRLALMPVPTDPSTLNLVGRVNDEGNPEYLVRYTLTKEGPCTVYSGDLESEDAAFAIADEKIPIVELLEGQRLILEATAILGQGTDHAKWQVAHACGYKYWPTATIDNRKISPEEAEAILANTPDGVLGMDGNKLVVLDQVRVNLADGHGVKLKNPEALAFEHDDRKFHFHFDTDGSLKAEDALLKAVELLKERFKDFQDHVNAL
jgi:DNA-directed RNA polymerase subunit D